MPEPVEVSIVPPDPLLDPPPSPVTVKLPPVELKMMPFDPLVEDMLVKVAVGVPLERLTAIPFVLVIEQSFTERFPKLDPSSAVPPLLLRFSPRIVLSLPIVTLVLLVAITGRVPPVAGSGALYGRASCREREQGAAGV